MMLLAFILSCMVAGSLACSDTHCKDRALADELMEVKFLPNKEQLKTLCPKVMTFMECEREYYECKAESELNEVESSVREGPGANALAIGISMVRDVCDEDSSFHRDYVASADCYRGFFQVASRMCRQDIMTPIETFFDDMYPSGEDMSDEAYAEIRCLSDVFEIACVIDNLGDSCGTVAQRLAITVMGKVKEADIVTSSCEGVKNAADLKTKFMNFLEFDDERRDRVQGFLDLIKRRR